MAQAGKAYKIVRAPAIRARESGKPTPQRGLVTFDTTFPRAAFARAQKPSKADADFLLLRMGPTGDPIRFRLGLPAQLQLANPKLK